MFEIMCLNYNIYLPYLEYKHLNRKEINRDMNLVCGLLWWLQCWRLILEWQE